jgi:hypothetical protein
MTLLKCLWGVEVHREDKNYMWGQIRRALDRIEQNTSLKDGWFPQGKVLQVEKAIGAKAQSVKQLGDCMFFITVKTNLERNDMRCEKVKQVIHRGSQCP